MSSQNREAFMHDRFRISWSIPILAVVLGGCQSHTRPAALDQARHDYEAGQFVKAEAGARQAMSAATGPDRAEAAYLAGLSSFRLGSIHTAETNFLIAAESSDRQVAARAQSMLGVIRLKQRRPSEAAVLFASAEPMLTGEDARQLARYAAIANQQAGDYTASRQWSSKSVSLGASPAGGSFSLQVGAFRERDHAERAAAEARLVADPQGLGPVRIVTSADERGRQLFLVQFGSFGSRSAAAGVRQRLGKLQYIVTLAGS